MLDSPDGEKVADSISKMRRRQKPKIQGCRVDFKTGKFVEIKTGMVLVLSGFVFSPF
jgi:hypothetical protein